MLHVADSEVMGSWLRLLIAAVLGIAGAALVVNAFLQGPSGPSGRDSYWMLIFGGLLLAMAAATAIYRSSDGYEYTPHPEGRASLENSRSMDQAQVGFGRMGMTINRNDPVRKRP